MKVTCFAIEAGGGLRPETEAAAVAGWRAGAGSYWIDVGWDRPEDATAWIVGLGLDQGLVEELHLGDDETRILPLTDSVFVAFLVMPGEDARTPVRFAYLCLDRLVITMHEQPEGYSGPDESLIAKVKLREATTVGVVCALAVSHSTRVRHYVGALRKKGDVLAGRMDPDPEAVSLEEILALKQRVLALGSVLDEELAALEVLKISDHPALPLTRQAIAFQAAIENMRATDRDIDRLDRRVSDLQHRYESAQQEKTNRRLGLLTVLSAIFMPLTLIAGIYGMNFEFMPELHWRYGYFLVLGAMAAIASGLGWYFRARWWSKP
jgi:magnesium transporter